MKYDKIKRRADYELLLSTGLLFEFYPELSGDYNKDFIIILSHMRDNAFKWGIYENQLLKLDVLRQSNLTLKTQLEVLRTFAQKLGLNEACEYLKK